MLNALIYVGCLKSYKLCIENHKNNIINPNNCDIFIVTSNTNCNGHIKRPCTYTEHDIDLYMEDILITFRKHYGDKLKSIKMFDEINGKIYTMRTLNLQYKLYAAFEIITQYEKVTNVKYDNIIYLRPDANNIPKIELKLIENKIKDNTIISNISPHEPNQIFPIISDHFAFGNRQSMEIYCNRGKDIKVPFGSSYIDGMKIYTREGISNEIGFDCGEINCYRKDGFIGNKNDKLYIDGYYPLYNDLIDMGFGDMSYNSEILLGYHLYKNNIKILYINFTASCNESYNLLNENHIIAYYDSANQCKRNWYTINYGGNNYSVYDIKKDIYRERYVPYSGKPVYKELILLHFSTI